MPYDFTLMRLPRPVPAGLEAMDDGPQAILRGQVVAVLAGIPQLQPREAGLLYVADPPGGPHIEVHIDPRNPPEFMSVEFDRDASQADYAAARAIVDQLCNGLRLTIMDDPDAGPTPTADAEAQAGGGLLDKIRGLFGR